MADAKRSLRDRIPTRNSRIGKAVGGCCGGCLVFLLLWAMSISICIAIAMVALGEDAVSVGIAWGSTLGLLIGVIFTGGVVAAVANLREMTRKDD